MDNIVSNFNKTRLTANITYSFIQLPISQAKLIFNKNNQLNLSIKYIDNKHLVSKYLSALWATNIMSSTFVNIWLDLFDYLPYNKHYSRVVQQSNQEASKLSIMRAASLQLACFPRCYARHGASKKRNTAIYAM
ncbi:hypothetical protein NTGM5_120056 [Candidatus Nitrotoga sp. M5]|nr:hypothetical protein NTGM5_120056 [Candidatus Nitrotoga sp. M5]